MNAPAGLTGTVMAYEVSPAILTRGVLTGLGYALLAVGLVLAYRSSRFINFAHSAIGIFAAIIMGWFVQELGLPYWIGFLVGLGVAAGIGIGTEFVVVRRLSDSPRVLAMIATLGLSQVLILMASLIASEVGLSNAFPAPPGFPTFDVGALQVVPALSALAILSPIVLVGIGLFLRFSKAGIGIRAAASNPDAAALAGVSPERMARISWGLAGAVAAFSAILFLGEGNVLTPETLGPSLLVRGLAAASIARFRNIPVAAACGVGIGVVEAVLATGDANSGLIELVLLVAILAALATERRSGREGETQNWGQLAADSRPPLAYRDMAVFRFAPLILGVVLLVAALGLSTLLVPSDAAVMNRVVAFAMVGASIALITGLGGQLTLGQFGIAGVGAAVSVVVVDRVGEWNWSPVAAMAAGAVVAALLGLPALRVRGLQLGVVTLAFALVASNWLLEQEWLLGSDGVVPGRPLHSPEVGSFLQVSIICLAVVLFLLRNLRVGAFGRKLVAVRDNEKAARAMSVSAMKVTVQANVLSGAVAGLGGALLAHGLSTVRAADFSVAASIDAVAVTVIGGLGSLFGSLLGSLYLIGIPGVIDLPIWGLALLNLGWIVLILAVPGGLAHFGTRIRVRVQDAIAAFLGAVEVPRDTPPPDPLDLVPDQAPIVLGELEAHGPQTPPPFNPASIITVPAQSPQYQEPQQYQEQPLQPGPQVQPAYHLPPVLAASGLVKRYGSVPAVDGVELAVFPGEVVGLIGPNGAGKTTLFELLSGFVHPDEGVVVFDGHDISSLTPNRRSELGLARSFQSATLFPTLSLLDTVMVARERLAPSTIRESMIGLGGRDREREQAALELIEAFGLGEFTEVPVGNLPTGTRRLGELACAVAMQPKLLLLDEPSAGIAQSEVEQLSTVLVGLRNNYGLTMVIIEHDLPMLSSVCDRMIALELGRIIAQGAPLDVQRHPEVVQAYMGTEQAAISRSGALITL
ncbi:MAG: ATP-binding cassette domain-containing protein [Actinomycetia bacterium]|nr:ATP-binding cassette domain-containing protein [Actinomycetes bacterium]